MLAGMTGSQFSEWKAFFQIERLGETVEERGDMRSAVNARNIINGINGRPIGADDWYPIKPEGTSQTDAETREQFRSRAEADKRRKERREAKERKAAEHGESGKPVRTARHEKQRVPQRRERVRTRRE